MCKKYFGLIISLLCLFTASKLCGQPKAQKKYPSLFWEITGNGLAKPSYLFGTMHVSNKMAFHLSDSFYYAMKNVDVVALELNPDLWQGQMVRLDKLKENYTNFIQLPGTDFLNENSFRINSYDPVLKAALSTEPTIINNLLYRSYKTREDFEEDTFLDMYIFQTGKKLGKRSAGVEDYNETEKVVLEAYAAMAKEKKKNEIDLDGESMKDIGQKIQDAYHSGDLDLMDSLDLLTERSDAFRESFLYKRNEIQAASIDTIIQKSSLFVGVGAAHLPGKRGVIELLRRMGYHLRPIIMADRDAIKKEETDQLKVPVQFYTIQADDGFYTVSVPGPLFKMKDEYQRMDRRQYADMNNGSYYLVTRVKTFAAFLGESETYSVNKVDSFLYENIPGKILSKTLIQKNGFKGFDITSRTRRGDLQRYNIFITPFEILIFKMSGKENYVSGDEGDTFFSSIHFTEKQDTNNIFTPSQGGFSITLPQAQNQYLNTNTNDGINRWEYQAHDEKKELGYIIFKKSVQNFNFLEEDSFDLKLIEESFRSPDYFDKQLSRKLTTWLGYPCLEVIEHLRNGYYVTARYVIKGPHYYCVAVSSKLPGTNFNTFFNSFRFIPYKYAAIHQYVDSFLHFSVSTPIVPELDNGYRDKLEKVTAEIVASGKYSGNSSYWPKRKNALFVSDSTGETIGVSLQHLPPYYFVKDSANFWTRQLSNLYDISDLLLIQKDSFITNNQITGYQFVLRDTGSSRLINRKVMLKGNYLLSLVYLGDTLDQQNNFAGLFFSSFTTTQINTAKSIFISRVDSFFKDLSGKDSIVYLKARQRIGDLEYGENDAPKIITAIHTLRADKYYVENKCKLIAALGNIKDTTGKVIINMLNALYKQVADTNVFQNEVLRALVQHKMIGAIQLFKSLVLYDPPIFDNKYEYASLINSLYDSLELAAILYPEILQLSSIEEYKKPVRFLLVTLVDSGFFKAGHYEGYFNTLYFDAKLALKKQQGKDEKNINQKKAVGNDEDENDSGTNEANNELGDYTVLLLPFYERNSSVVKYIDKLLQIKDDDTRLNTAVILLRNHKGVADSIIEWYASKDKWRGLLYTRLEKINCLDKFPKKYRTQTALARSFLITEKGYNNIDSIVMLENSLVSFNGNKGIIYFFKYRVKKGDEWKIGLSGLQPENLTETSSGNTFSVMTERKLKGGYPAKEQFEEQLKRILFSFRKSGANFFEQEKSNYHFKKIGDYEEH